MELLEDSGGSGSGGPGLLIEGFDSHVPTGYTITARAETLGSSIGDIENFDSRLSSTHNTATEGLAGIIAEDLADAPATARNQARDVVQGTTVAAGALTVYGTAINTYNDNVSGWNATIGSHATADEQREAKTELSSQHATAVDDLETAARTCKKHLEDPLNPNHIATLYAAGALPIETPAIFGNLDLELTDADHRAAYEKMIEDMTPAERDAYIQSLLDDPEANADIIGYLPVTIRQQVADEIAARAENIRNSDVDDVAVDDLNDLTGLLDAYGDDAVVATQFLNEVGPEGLLDLNLKVVSSGVNGDVVPDEHAQAIQNLQLALGSTLAAGTQGSTATTTPYGSTINDPGSDTNVSTEWVQQLLDAGEQEFEVPGGFDNQEGPRGYQLLSPLLANGSQFDPNFLSKVGTNMVLFEQYYDYDEDPNGPWERDNGIVGTDQRWDWTQGWDNNEHTLGNDPVPSLMRGLGDNPEASRQFFTTTTTYPPDGPPYNDMVKYMLHERGELLGYGSEWPLDRAMGVEETLTGFDTLGDALKSATIGDGADERSVSVMETLVHTTFERYDDEDADVFSKEDFLPPSLRPDLAEITAHYMGSVHDSYRTEPDGDLIEDYVFDDAELHDPNGGARSLTLFLAELGKDPSGQDTLTAASNLWTTDQLATRLDGIEDPSEIERDVTPILRTSGNVIGAIDFGAESDIAQEYADDAERHNNNVDFAAGAGKTLINELAGKLPGSSLLTDPIIDGIAGGLHEDNTSNSNRDVGALFSNTQETQQTLVRDALWASLPEDAYPPDADASTYPDDYADFKQWLEDSDWGRELDTRAGDMEQAYNDGRQNAADQIQHDDPN